MDDFLLIFRRDFTQRQNQPPPSELLEYLKDWQNWFGNIVAQNKLSRPLQRNDGKGNHENGNELKHSPFVKIKESIGGLIIIKAKDYEEAYTIAQSCPILRLGGKVEVRMAAKT